MFELKMLKITIFEIKIGEKNGLGRGCGRLNESNTIKGVKANKKMDGNQTRTVFWKHWLKSGFFELDTAVEFLHLISWLWEFIGFNDISKLQTHNESGQKIELSPTMVFYFFFLKMFFWKSLMALDEIIYFEFNFSKLFFIEKFVKI